VDDGQYQLTQFDDRLRGQPGVSNRRYSSGNHSGVNQALQLLVVNIHVSTDCFRGKAWSNHSEPKAIGGTIKVIPLVSQISF
jgi:hypothetical protein